MSPETVFNSLTTSVGIGPRRTYKQQDRTVIVGTFSGRGIESATVASLVEGAAEGDQHAWRELVHRFGGMIASVGRRYGLCSADIGELQQITWLRLVENLHRIEQPERIGGWLATTASRQCLQLLKRASRYTIARPGAR